MAHDYPRIDPALHQKILEEKILRDPDLFLHATSVDRPRVIITAGQPGAGKSKIARQADTELGGNAVTVDPDQLREKHPQVDILRQQHPYTWSGQTHGDASQWATELRDAAVAQRKNIILDTTMPRADVIKDLQAKGYQVEVRAIATHKLESELGVDKRFGDALDELGHGRHVPSEVREAVYQKLPNALDEVAQQTGVPIQVYDREGRLHFDSRTSPSASPGQALETAREARLTPERLNDLQQRADTQREWHRTLPERVPNDKVAPPTAERLLEERTTQGVQKGVEQVQRDVRATRGAHAIPGAIKAAGIAGTVYGAYDAKGQIDTAIDTARSNREQWVRGAEEAANQGTKAVVTGAAATVGAIPGAAAGALTSPVTGPIGPVVGGLATGGAAAVGAEKLYEESRLQQFSKTLGREAGQLGYDYVSREGRLLRQVNGLKADLQTATDPAERARLQTRLASASEQFTTEAERNGRTFEGRAHIDKAWEQTQAQFPKVDKDDAQDALSKHIDAGKRPGEAARAAISDAVHEQYPRQLPHHPVENYGALSNQQLAQKHRQYVGEVSQGQAQLAAQVANKDSHNNTDQGWPKALAEQRQAARVQAGATELWKDTGHLGAIRQVYQERGLPLPELPQALRANSVADSVANSAVDSAANRSGVPTPAAAPASPTVSTVSPRDALRQQENSDRSRESTDPGRSPRAHGQAAVTTQLTPQLTPQQQRHHDLANAQLGPPLGARGHGAEEIGRVSAAAVRHAQDHAHRGEVRAFYLSKDGERVAVVQESAPMSEFSVRAAQSQTADQHLALAHQTAHEQTREQKQEQTREQNNDRSHADALAPAHSAPQRTMA